jgi:hypothetical protein
MKTRFRPSLRQFRILEAANTELKNQIDNIVFVASLCGFTIVTNGNAITIEHKVVHEKAKRLNWFLLTLILAYAFKDIYQFFTR